MWIHTRTRTHIHPHTRTTRLWDRSYSWMPTKIYYFYALLYFIIIYVVRSWFIKFKTVAVFIFLWRRKTNKRPSKGSSCWDVILVFFFFLQTSLILFKYRQRIYVAFLTRRRIDCIEQFSYNINVCKITNCEIHNNIVLAVL